MAFGLRMPPPGVLALLVVHTTAFIARWVATRDVGPRALAYGTLSGTQLHWPAILLHPYGATDILMLLLLLISVIGTLGTLIEHRFGFRTLLLYYVLGNLVAGAAYFGLAWLAPTLARMPLAFPLGATTAWAVLAWREVGDLEVNVFGAMLELRRVLTWLAAISGLWVLLLARDGREGALAWLVGAIVAGFSPLLRALPQRLHRAVWSRRRRVVRPSRVSPRAALPEPMPEVVVHEPDPIAEDIDAILRKISASGISSLTPEERNRLEAARQALLKHPG